MSISFAEPPKVVRASSPPSLVRADSGGSATIHGAVAGTANSMYSVRRERHGSHSSMRSTDTSDTAGKRPRSPQHKRFEKKRVSFSTLDNEDASMVSLTLRTKHEAYKFSKRSRSFIIGYNDDEYSKSAMDWLVDTMVDDGDEIIALRVVDPKFALSSDDAEEKLQLQAKKMQQEIINLNREEDKELSIVVELAVGNIKLLLLRLMHLYHPDSLIVGTKGRSLNGISSLKAHSISKWCLQNSPVPVIVVRPDRKRDKARQKRLQDPNRRSYVEILEKSSSFEDLTTAFNTSAISSGRTSRESPRTTPIVVEPSRAAPALASSSRSSRSSQQHTEPERSSRGKSPLGRISHKVSKVFGGDAT